MRKQHPWTSESDRCKGENDEFCQRMGKGKWEEDESSVEVHTAREATQNEIQLNISSALRTYATWSSLRSSARVRLFDSLGLRTPEVVVAGCTPSMPSVQNPDVRRRVKYKMMSEV